MCSFFDHENKRLRCGTLPHAVQRADSVSPLHRARVRPGAVRMLCILIFIVGKMYTL